MRQSRWKEYRSAGSVLLGSALWINDPELIDKLEKLAGACIVITKQPPTTREVEKLEPLRQINQRAPGLPIRAFPALSGLAPKINGKPMVVGPYDAMDEMVVPTIRTLGFRRRERHVPLMHAKLVLLGHLWWHDEDALGHVADVVGFTPKRLWISSANFTTASRQSLEFGYWTEDAALMRGAQRFLLRLIGSSEDLDAEADSFEPEFAPVEFDHDAMLEALAEVDPAEADEDADEI